MREHAESTVKRNDCFCDNLQSIRRSGADQSQSSSLCLGAAAAAAAAARSTGSLPVDMLDTQAVATAMEEKQEETDTSCHVKSNPISPLSTRLSNSGPGAHPSRPAGGGSRGERGGAGRAAGGQRVKDIHRESTPPLHPLLRWNPSSHQWPG